MTVHNLLFCADTLYMNYIIKRFLTVSSSVRSKQLLCFVHGQGHKSKQKPTTRKFVGFPNHFPLLTLHLLFPPKTSAQAFGITAESRTPEVINKRRDTIGTEKPFPTTHIMLVTPPVKTAIPTDKGPTRTSFTTHAQTVVIIGIAC